MSHESKSGIFGEVLTFHCDGASCDAEHEAITGSTFKEAIEEIKTEGWSIAHSEGDFYHYCPGCSEERDY
jgi:hypothetical protein